MAIAKKTRDKIVAQALQEITFARRYKQGKVYNWQKNEDMYYGRKVKADDSRANVDLARMQEYVHTWLSKIDNPLTFKFTKRKESQLKRVARLNSLRKADQDSDDWDIKDIAGKKQVAIYGRAIYWYYADSAFGYQAHLDPVDVYDFLIDPSGGGIDVEKARFMGRYGVVKDKEDLLQGVRDGLYLKYEVNLLTGGEGNADESTQEETNKRNRANDTGVAQTKKEAESTTDKFKFWEWLTTFEGKRYYLLLTEKGATAVRIEELDDMFSPTKLFPKGAWPVWSYAACPDLTEFWTPGPCDWARELFMAQAVTVNQILDNSEQINKPQKAIDTGAIPNLAQLKYRRDGNIHLKPGTDAQKAIQFFRPPELQSPLKVFDLLEGIQQKASGVNAGTEGAEKVDGKVGIYEGNQAAAADRFGLVNKSYSFGYKRFARLFEIGVRDHLTKKVAVEIIGPSGIETEEINRRDIFHKSDDFGVAVEASDAEEQASSVDQKNKLQFMDAVLNSANPKVQAMINPKKAFEIQAKVAGLSEDDIKQLLDTSEYGNAEIISEAELDIEALLEGKPVKPNKGANLAYKQHVVDYLIDHEDDMDHEQFMRIANYMESLEEIVMANTARELNAKITAMRLQQEPPTGAGGPGGGVNINPQDNSNGGEQGIAAAVSAQPGPDQVQVPAA